MNHNCKIPKLDEDQKRIWTENGLERLRYEYDLDKNSVVYDIGACEGTFLKEIYKRFNCNIVAYEPVKKHYDNIIELFSNKIKIFSYAVGSSDRTVLIDKDSETLTATQTNELYEIKYVDINKIIKSEIDLMKINIEGGEYELLRAIKPSKLKIINNLQIQFHIIDNNSTNERLKIHEKLRKTHKLTYEYPFCWENWELI